MGGACFTSSSNQSSNRVAHSAGKFAPGNRLRITVDKLSNEQPRRLSKEEKAAKANPGTITVCDAVGANFF
jgi:hypothetical protein